jgi:hypothetical protein
VRQISINPKQTFLRTEPQDVSLAPAIIDLTSLGAQPGSKIGLQEVGSFTYDFRLPETGKLLNAVFSSTNAVLAATTANRVPDAISASLTYVSDPTVNLRLPTDIPNDFAFDNVGMLIQVPAGARFLIIGVPDGWYSDNADADGDLGVRLTCRS